MLNILHFLCLRLKLACKPFSNISIWIYFIVSFTILKLFRNLSHHPCFSSNDYVLSSPGKVWPCFFSLRAVLSRQSLVLFCDPKNRSYGVLILPQIYLYKFPFGIRVSCHFQIWFMNSLVMFCEPKNSLNGLLILPESYSYWFPLDN